MSTGYAFPEWDATDATKAATEAVIDEMYERKFENLNEMGDKFKALQSPILNLFFGMTEDWDVVIWMLLQSTRACGAIPGYEEFLWLSALTGLNGKGTWIALMIGLLGYKLGQYYASLDFETHFVGSGMAGLTTKAQVLPTESLIH